MSAQNIWITGASTGIGAAVALRLAQLGHRVAITARSEDKLAALSENLSAFKGQIFPYPGDVTDAKAMTKLVAQIEAEMGHLDMAILNAGAHFPDKSKQFSAELCRKTFDLNVQGVANCLEPILDRFRPRKAGHIAIVASVAGFRGLPSSLTYGPSKAALINMAEALAIECKPMDIKVQVVNPGFVKTPLTDKNDFPMPMLMDVNDAARAMADGLFSNRFEINFPRSLCYLKKAIDMLPNRAYLWVMRSVLPKVLN
ncbi:MAG TPA: SDR family NAD(P)-dependent oxidoreductase [Alphaproteobacteria bacterium]|nr:SDR family NAD(P)-dependent oxidoreductase [Alphaproteobacteria bacterium]